MAGSYDHIFTKNNGCCVTLDLLDRRVVMLNSAYEKCIKLSFVKLEKGVTQSR